MDVGGRHREGRPPEEAGAFSVLGRLQALEGVKSVLAKEAIESEEAAKTDIRWGNLRFVQKIKSPPFNSFADNEYLPWTKRNKR